MPQRIRCALSLISLLLLFIAPPSLAQLRQNLPVRLILPVPAGGGMDALARALTDRLSENLKRPVIVESRPGAAGNIAAEHVASSAPDGSTLLLAFDSVATVNPLIYPKTPFAPEPQLKPVALIGLWSFILVTHPSVEAKTVKDLAALSKTKPLRIASSGSGSTSHLAIVYLQNETGVDYIHVPYRGAAPAIADILGGHADAMFAVSPLVLPNVKAGKLRALGQTGRVRSPLAADVPTMIEGGLQNFDMTSAYILFAPVATPEATVKEMYAALNDTVQRPEVRERIIQQDVAPILLPAADAESFIERTRARLTPIVKAANVTAN